MMVWREPTARRHPGLRPWLLAAALFLVTALAAFLRFWRLDVIPPGFHYDEAYEALEAWRVVTQPGYHPIFFPGNFGVEPTFIYLTALAFKLADATPHVMRGVAAAVGTLTVPALYGLGRELVRNDERIPRALPLFAALALAINRWHLHFSRVGIEPVLVPFVLTLMLWAFWHARRANRLLSWLAFGALAGLGPYTYPAGRLLPVIAFALGLIEWARRSTSPGAGSQGGKWGPLRLRILAPLLFAGAVALAVFAPLALHWVQHPDQLLLRSSQIATGTAGEADGTPVRNLLATLGMFNLRGDLDPRNNQPGVPVLDVLMSIPFLVGVVGALWRWRRPAVGATLLAGAVMLIPTVLSEYAPHFRRALGAAPVVALTCGLGLAILLGHRSQATMTPPTAVPDRLQSEGVSADQIAAGMDRLRGVGRALIVMVILLGSLAFTIAVYFVRWANNPAVFYAYDQGLWQIGQYVLGLPAEDAVYITPRPATDTTLAFAWREGRPVRHFDGRSAFVAAAPDRPTNYIVIEHEDFRGGQLLRSLYPVATETHTFRDWASQVYARAYRVTPGSVAARQPKNQAHASWPGIDLVGFDLDRADATYQPDDIIYLQLWWHATGSSENDWTVFTHLLGPARPDGNRVWAGRDAQPGQGSVPTSAWVPGDLILDEYQLQLPADAPPGDYQIEVGLYNPAQDGARAITAVPAGQDHLLLGTVRVQ